MDFFLILPHPEYPEFPNVQLHELYVCQLWIRTDKTQLSTDKDSK